MIKHYIKKRVQLLIPSSKVGEDITISYDLCGSLQPIPINGLSLTAPMKKKILSIRKKNKKIPLYRDKKILTLIVPYRNREGHLKEFLPFIQKLLNAQGIDYEIIITQQDDSHPFNRAKLMNIGVIHAKKESDYFIFHDVDAIPYDVDYRYCNQTVKIFNYIQKDRQGYKKYPETIFGGVTLVPKDIFYDINGFSNNYWQWGKEDDDFLMRHFLKGYIPFYDTNGKLDMLPHPKALKTDVKGKETTEKKILQQNKELLKQNKRLFSNFKRGLHTQEDDGINSLKDYIVTSLKVDGKIKTLQIQFTKIS